MTMMILNPNQTPVNLARRGEADSTIRISSSTASRLASDTPEIDHVTRFVNEMKVRSVNA